MKYKWLALLLLVASLSSSFSASKAQENSISIAELYRQTRNGWQSSYTVAPHSQSNATIGDFAVNVNIDITVPQVAKCPIVALQINHNAAGALAADGYAEVNTLYDSKTGEGIVFDYYAYPVSEHVQAEHSPLTVEDADFVYTQLAKQYFEVSNVRARGIVGFQQAPEQMADVYPKLEHGMYMITGEQVFEGIPLLMSGWNQQCYFPDIHITAQVYDQNLYMLQGHTLIQNSILYDDVPLLPWADIQKAIETQVIFEGKLKQIYSIEFGYQLVLLEQPTGTSVDKQFFKANLTQSAFDVVYHVRPVWTVRGQRVTPSTSLQSESADVPIYSQLGMDGEEPIVLDAQTGALVFDFADMRQSNSVNPSIQCWPLHHQ